MAIKPPGRGNTPPPLIRTPLRHIKIDPITGTELDRIITCLEQVPDCESPPCGECDYVSVLSDSQEPHGCCLVSALEFNTRLAPVRSVLITTRRRWGAVGIIERPYLDMEYWDNHAGLYAKCFGHYGISCNRLHFFTNDVLAKSKQGNQDNKHIAENIQISLYKGITWERIKTEIGGNLEYLGYCVLRPTPCSVVSRTALRFDTRRKGETPRWVRNAFLKAERNDHPVLRVSMRRSVNLLSTQLSVTAPEFIQQDPNLGNCGTASIWVATHGNKGNLLDPGLARYSRLTYQAIEHEGFEGELGRLYDLNAGDRGLNYEEIRRAITKNGSRCFREMLPKKGPMGPGAQARSMHQIVCYLNSGYPVLIGGGRLPPHEEAHVVAAVGLCQPHSLIADEMRPASLIYDEMKTGKSPGNIHYFTSTATRVLYAHDDEYGPYCRLVFPSRVQNRYDSPSMAETTGSCEEGLTYTLGSRGPRRYRCHFWAVPLPDDVRQSWMGCAQVAFRLVEDHLKTCSDRSENEQPSLAFDPKNQLLMWQSVLIRGSEFKQSVTIRADAEQQERLVEWRKWYAQLHLPRYVWLLEASVAQRSGINHHDLRADCEIVFDATAPDTQSCLLATRIGGNCWNYSGDTTTLPSSPYQPAFFDRQKLPETQ